MTREQKANRNVASGAIVVETINVTNYERAEDAIATRNADIAFIQEHTTRQVVVQGTIAGAIKREMDVHLGKACEVGPQVGAGVGAVRHIKAKLECVPCPCVTKECKKYEHIGRLGRYQIANGQWSAEVYNIYGYTNGATRRIQAQKTDEIIAAIQDEREAEGKKATIILGDFNAELKDISTAWEALQAGELHDVATLPRGGI